MTSKSQNPARRNDQPIEERMSPGKQLTHERLSRVSAAEIATKIPVVRKEESGWFRGPCPFTECADHPNNDDAFAWHEGGGYICHRCGNKGNLGSLANMLGLERRRNVPPITVRTEDEAWEYLKRRIGKKAGQVLETYGAKMERDSSGHFSVLLSVGKRLKYVPLVSGKGRKGWDSALEWLDRVEGKRTIRPGNDAKPQVIEAYADRLARAKAECPAAPNLLGLEQLEAGGHTTVYMVEGEMDFFSMVAAGHPCLAVTKGAQGWSTPSDAKKQAVHEAEIEELRTRGVKHIRLLFDNDSPGFYGSWNTALMRRGYGFEVEVLRFPRNRATGWDINDEWQRSGHDPVKFEESLDRLRSVHIPPEPPGGHYTPRLEGGWFEPPCGYALSPTGTWRYRTTKNGKVKWMLVSSSPLWLSEIQQGIDSNKPFWTIGGLYHGKLRHVTLSQREALSPSGNGVSSLNDHGLQVLPQNVQKVINYFARAEEANFNHLPRRWVVGRNGWMASPEANAEGFVLGTRLITPRGEELVVPDPTRPNHEYWFKQLRTEGSDEEWAKLLPKVQEHPRALLAILSSMASPLLHRLGVNPFVVEIYGVSSRGKTTVARIGNSVWGRSEIEDLPSWASTVYALGTRAEFMNNLWLVCDETKQWRQEYGPEKMRSWLYTFTGAKDGDRGTQSGELAQMKDWKSILFSTGEWSVTDGIPDTGIVTRVFSFEGEPFPNGSRELVESLEVLIERNFGHAGYRLIQALVRNTEEDWEALRAYHRNCADLLYERSRTKASNSSRRAKWFATFFVAAKLLSDLYPEHTSHDSIKQSLISLWDEVEREAEEGIYLHQRALEAVLAHVSTFHSAFKRDANTGKAPNPNHGMWDKDGSLWVTTAWLRSFLPENKMAFKVVVNQWAKLGWIEIRENQPISGIVKKINGVTARAVHILRHAIDEVLPEGED